MAKKQRAQRQSNSGQNSILVQVGGDNNRITITHGAASLSLDLRHKRKSEPKSVRDLLLTDLRVTDLVGRDRELGELQEWLDSSEHVSVHCLTGQGGSGKTRLAIELCERAEALGWVAGFAGHDELERFYSQGNLSNWRWLGSTLIVVDYAAVSVQTLRKWLEALSRHVSTDQAQPLRLLLLERNADKEIGWWKELTGTGGLSGHGPDYLIDPAAPFLLTSIRSLDDRRAIFARSFDLASRLEDRGMSPGLPKSDTGEDFDRLLLGENIDKGPLYLIMAGVVAVHVGGSAAMSMGRTRLAMRIAEAELTRIRKLAVSWGVSGDFMAHSVACITLQGGCERKSVLDVLESERDALGVTIQKSLTEIANKLADALPGTGDTWVDAIRPDLIGEAFALIVLRQDKQTIIDQQATVERAWRRAGGRVVSTVVRIVQDYSTSDPSNPALACLDAILAQANDLYTLYALEREIPAESVLMRDHAASVRSQIVVLLRQQFESGCGEKFHLARALNNYSVSLSYLGHLELALAAASEAASLHCELSENHPDPFRFDLATSLNTLSTRLSALGHRDEALNAAKQAVAIYREFAVLRPDAFRPNLAAALSNLSIRLSELGYKEDALDAGREVVNIYSELALVRPDAFRHFTAVSLNNLANTLSQLGHREEALSMIRKASAIRRELATANPDAFRPGLASSLNNLALMLRRSGLHKEALSAVQEAVGIFSDLSVDRPGVFRHSLATSKNTLATMLSELGHPEDALEASRTAADIFRELFAERPDTFRPDLAMSLFNLAVYISGSGQGAEVVEIAAEAIVNYRYLYDKYPRAFKQDLYDALMLLSRLQQTAGLLSEAAATKTEADGIGVEISV